jgi:cytidylate kinase
MTRHSSARLSHYGYDSTVTNGLGSIGVRSGTEVALTGELAASSDWPSDGFSVSFSGLTAAGKTTHSAILAEQLGYRLVSAGDLMVRAARIDEPTAGVWFRRMDTLEAERRSNDVDGAVDAELRDAARGGRTVFDAVAMPWLGVDDLIRVWIESDRLSRSWKCYVSQEPEPSLDLVECAHLMDRKDDFTRSMFADRYRADVVADRTRFDAILNNTHLIEEPTRDAARAGIAAFAVVVEQVIAFLAGARNDLAGLLADPSLSRCVEHVRGYPTPADEASSAKEGSW